MQLKKAESNTEETLDLICDELKKANSLKETELEMKQAELDKLDEILALLKSKERGNYETK